MYNKRISERSGNNMMEVQQYMLDKIGDFKAKVCNPEAHLNNMASCDKELSDDARQPKCPKEKEEVIVEALRYFQMIPSES